jgi:signal recognition particle subunit SRP54
MLDRNKASDFNLDDFKKQVEQVKNIGMKDMLHQMPGMEGMIPAGKDPEAEMERVTKMIDAMTKEERQNPSLVGLTERQRIASDSGTTTREIEAFLAQFEQVRVLTRQLAKKSLFDRLKWITDLGGPKIIEPTDETDDTLNGN